MSDEQTEFELRWQLAHDQLAIAELAQQVTSQAQLDAILHDILDPNMRAAVAKVIMPFVGFRAASSTEKDEP